MNGINTGMTASVTAEHRGMYEILLDGQAGRAVLKASSFLSDEARPTVGDLVELDAWDGADGRIRRVLPRKSVFTRLDPSSSGHAGQALAANFEYVFLLQSLNHDFNPRRLERYLALTHASGAVPVVILTKADVAIDGEEKIRAARENYREKILVVSAKTGQGLDEVRDILAPGITAALLGSSGVGKSTLVNALLGEEKMDTGGIREDDSRGRHTTTYRQMVFLPTGARLIDTPGMREVGMWDADEGIVESFPEIEALLGKCRYSNCRHGPEAGCAIQAAIARGELSREKWNSYRKLAGESPARRSRKPGKKIPGKTIKNRGGYTDDED